MRHVFKGFLGHCCAKWLAAVRRDELTEVLAGMPLDHPNAALLGWILLCEVDASFGVEAEEVPLCTHRPARPFDDELQC